MDIDTDNTGTFSVLLYFRLRKRTTIDAENKTIKIPAQARLVRQISVAQHDSYRKERIL